MKKSIIESKYKLLRTEYHYTPKNAKALVYICECVNSECLNEIRIWSSASRHNGYCNSCADINNRRKPYTYLYTSFLNSQKHRNIDVTLTFENFVALCETPNCHYCDALTSRDKHRKKIQSNAYMIDRKDNNLGYTVENSLSCCWDCNNLKSNKFSYEEFLKLRTFIKTEFGR